MENRLKLRLPRLFRSSLSACNPRNSSQIVENSVFAPQTSFHKPHPISPKSRLSPTIRRAETPRRCRVSEEHSPLFFVSTQQKTSCPPASPDDFPENPFYEETKSFRSFDNKEKIYSKSSKRKTKGRSKKRSMISSDYLFSSSSFDGSTRVKSTGSWCWSSSDEEQDETDTLFSSRSFSSDSSTSRRKNTTSTAYEMGFSQLAVKNDKDETFREKPISRVNKTTGATAASNAIGFSLSAVKNKKAETFPKKTISLRNNKIAAAVTETGFSPLAVKNEKDETFREKPISCRNTTVEPPASTTESGDIGSDGETAVPPLKDSFAVVKRSSDPYEDFRTSMVEMIVERQIFAAADLEQLLRCFISLNSRRHHRIIVEVFLEIYDALFTT